LLQAQNDEGFMKIQDAPTATQRRWRPQQTEPQRKMMQFGSGAVRSTTVTGSCFSINSKKAPAASGHATEIDDRSQLNCSPEEQQKTAAEVCTAEEPERAGVQPITAALSDVSAKEAAAVQACSSHETDLQCKHSATPAEQPSAGHHMEIDDPIALDADGAHPLPHHPLVSNASKQRKGREGVIAADQSSQPSCTGAAEPQCHSKPCHLDMQASFCAPSESNLVACGAQTQQPASTTNSKPAAQQDVANDGCKGDANLKEFNPQLSSPEGFRQAMLKAAPQLLPCILASCPSGSSCSAPSQSISPQLCECSKQLCKQVAATQRESDSRLAAAALAAHWTALNSSEQRAEFAAELVSEIVRHICVAAESTQECSVLSALTAFSAKHCTRLNRSRCEDDVGCIVKQLEELLGTCSGVSFSSARCASVLWQAQTQIGDAQPRICDAVAQELCKGVDAAVKRLEESCEEGEMPDQGSQWFVRMQLSALVGLISVHNGQDSLMRSLSIQRLMQMLTAANDLDGAVSSAVGLVCGDLGCSSVFRTCHEDIIRFWDAGDRGEEPLQVNPCALMLQVALCAVAAAAKDSKRCDVTVCSGDVLWGLGERVWGWSPAGTMHMVCAGLVQMLESAGTDALSPVWSMFRERDQLCSLLDASASCTMQGPSAADVDAASCDSESSSSSDDSDSDGEREEEEGTDTGGLADAMKDSRLEKQKPEHAVLNDVCEALKFAARCCGWEWAAHSLLDGMVWPVFEKLQKLDSPVAGDVRSIITELIRDLMDVVLSLANGDVTAAEYVTTVQEALQFYG
jgi:hypothetical protein